VIRKLLLHLSQYSLGSLLTAVAGLVSFPFLTRIFSVSDYGLMNLVSATLTALVAVGKFGLQHSVVRFGSSIHGGSAERNGEEVVSTVVLGMAAMGTLVAVVWLAVVPHLTLVWSGDARLRILLGLVSALVVIQVVDSALTNLLRAQQRSGFLTTYQVVKKYVGLGLMIAALLLIRRDLYVFYSAQIALEAAGALVLGVVLFRKGSGLPRPTLAGFSMPLLKEMLRYGVPMMLGWELSGIILSLGDRYVIQTLLGPGPLGSYAAAYNLCQYVEVVLLTPWSLAIMPIYVRLWEEGGEGPTRTFLERSLHYYILLGIPVVAGMAAVGPELLTVLASDKYRSGASIIPAVVAGLVFGGAVPIVGAGVFIQKRTWLVARSVFLCALLNLGLNVVWVPAFGIRGAAIATLVAYAALLGLMMRTGSKQLPIRMPWGVVVRASGAAAVMLAVVTPLELGGSLGNVAIRVATGVLTYLLLIVLLDRTARDGLAALMTRATRDSL